MDIEARCEINQIIKSFLLIYENKNLDKKITDKQKSIKEIIRRFQELESIEVTKQQLCNQLITKYESALNQAQLEKKNIYVRSRVLLQDIAMELKSCIKMFQYEIKQQEDDSMFQNNNNFEEFLTPGSFFKKPNASFEVSKDKLQNEISHCFPIPLPCVVQCLTSDEFEVIELYLLGKSKTNYFVQLKQMGFWRDPVVFSSLSEAFIVLNQLYLGSRSLDLKSFPCQSLSKHFRFEFQDYPHKYLSDNHLSIHLVCKKLIDLMPKETKLFCNENNNLESDSQKEFPEKWKSLIGSRLQSH